jgi:hypothetical protein
MRKTSVKVRKLITKLSTTPSQTTTGFYNSLIFLQTNTQYIHRLREVFGCQVRDFYTSTWRMFPSVWPTYSPQSTTTTNYYYEVYIKEI